MEEENRSQVDNTNSVVNDSVTYYQRIYSPFQYLFSKMYGQSIWIMSFKWYTILFLIIIASTVFVLSESIIEQRKERRKLKKEGMKSSSREETDEFPEKDRAKKSKKVTFEMDTQRSFYSRTRETFIRLYSLLILPSVYALFRTFGVR